MNVATSLVASMPYLSQISATVAMASASETACLSLCFALCALPERLPVRLLLCVGFRFGSSLLYFDGLRCGCLDAFEIPAANSCPPEVEVDEALRLLSGVTSALFCTCDPVSQLSGSVRALYYACESTCTCVDRVELRPYCPLSLGCQRTPNPLQDFVSVQPP